MFSQASLLRGDRGPSNTFDLKTAVLCQFDVLHHSKTRRKVPGMSTAVVTPNTIEEPSDIDPIDEMRLRTWARKNYAPASKRPTDWHPIILDEMGKKDREQA
jgi:hypothetical protein